MATSMIQGLYDDYIKAQPKAQTYNPAQAKTVNWNVAPEQTVQGQLGSMLSNGSPLWQQATTRGEQSANRRGLQSSSIGAQAGQAALMDVAVPIATSDASMFGRAGEFNALQGNENSRFNTGESNKASMLGAEWDNRLTQGTRDTVGRMMLQKDDQGFRAGENATERAFRTGERLGDETFRSGEAVKTRDFNAGESALTRGHNTSERIGGQDFRAGESTLQRGHDTSERLAGEDFRSGESKLTRDFNTSERVAGEEATARRDVTTHSNRLAELGFANDLATAKVPTQYAAGLSQAITAQVAAIMANGDLTPDARRGAISNIITFANNSLKWAEIFFKTDMPDFFDPSTP